MQSQYNYSIDLEVSFPEISRELHTKKAAFEILEFEKTVLKNNLQSGQLNDKEFYRMKRNIDKKMKNLNDLNPSCQMPSLIDIITQHEIEESFGRDQLIFKEGNRVIEICIITRGAGNEFSDRSKIRERQALNEVTPIYMLVAPQIRYQTSFMADYVINATFIKIQTMQNIMKYIPEFEGETLYLCYVEYIVINQNHYAIQKSIKYQRMYRSQCFKSQRKTNQSDLNRVEYYLKAHDVKEKIVFRKHHQKMKIPQRIKKWRWILHREMLYV